MKRSKATAFYAISCLVCCLSAGMTVRQAAAEVEIRPVPPAPVYIAPVPRKASVYGLLRGLLPAYWPVIKRDNVVLERNGYPVE